jgi:L-ribulose-5-phosphate 4-epimerase
MLSELKEKVLQANLLLPKYGLVTFTWGNVSGIDRESGIMVIKPSGVEYDEMTADMLVCVDLKTGDVVDGRLRPSSDTPTHLALYQAYPDIGGVVHTHSRWATIFAQAGRSIPPLGTTHADYFNGIIPVTRALSREEVESQYERMTGEVIVETIRQELSTEMTAVLVSGHAPFTWGKDPVDAVNHSVILEEVAMMAWHTLMMNPSASLDPLLLDKHYQRKHGKNAYYGQ